MKNAFFGALLLAAVCVWYAMLTGGVWTPYVGDASCQPDAGYTP